MRILYIDLDSQRADHLGCYGYHRDTSPNIDAIAAQGVRFTGVYASDTPCLPARSALITGQFGIHNGAVAHGGSRAQPFNEGLKRPFQSRLGQSSWTRLMRKSGIHSVSVSSFPERHSAYHWCAGFNEIHNPGGQGFEAADDVSALALDWIDRKGATDDWFLHVHYWDAHTPYRTPAAFGNPFQDDPLPAWLTEDVRRAHWELGGPHSIQEMLGYTPDGDWPGMFERLQPRQGSSMHEIRRMFDGYDIGVRYSDEHVGRLLDALAKKGVLDETAVIITADHGETLGELGIYCDHQTADHQTANLPLILRWPGVPAPRVDGALRYQIDVAATVLQLLGVDVPEHWDGIGFADALRSGEEDGRDFLVVSQAAWACQRSVRFDEHLLVRTYHDAFHLFPDVMLFDVVDDPHQQRDLATADPARVAKGLALLENWHTASMATSSTGIDPLWVVMNEGGPYHTAGRLPSYLKRLRETGRNAWADRLARKYPNDRPIARHKVEIRDIERRLRERWLAMTP